MVLSFFTEKVAIYSLKPFFGGGGGGVICGIEKKWQNYIHYLSLNSSLELTF